MTAKNKSEHKFGDALLKQEDEAKIFSLKRETLAQIRKGYASKKMIETYLFLPALITVVIGAFLNNKIVWIIGIVCFFISLIITLIRARTDDLNAEEEYIRTRFDKEYGKGKYNETIEKIYKRKNERWKK